MKRFLLKTLAFIVVLLAVNVAIGELLPFRKFYGNEMVEKKVRGLSDDFDNYNVFFFGSSRVATGINPYVFDSLAINKGNRVNSYNLASFGTWFNEDFYIINSLLDQTSISNSVFFIELQQVMSIRWDKIDEDKNIYYQDLNNYLFILNYIRNREVKSPKDVLVSVHYTFAYSISKLLNMFNVGKLNGLESVDLSSRGFDEKGFVALKENYEGDTLNITNYQTKASDLFESSEGAGNKAHLEKIRELIVKAERKNIKIIFILTPANYTPEMVSIYKALPADNKTDYRRFFNQDEIFKYHNWADGGHLNTNGAKAYSKLLAEEFLLKINGRDDVQSLLRPI